MLFFLQGYQPFRVVPNAHAAIPPGGDAGAGPADAGWGRAADSITISPVPSLELNAPPTSARLCFLANTLAASATSVTNSAPFAALFSAQAVPTTSSSSNLRREQR